MVESNPSSSVAALVAAGPSRADASSRMEVELKTLFPHYFHQPSRFSSRGNAATNNQRRPKKPKAKGSKDKNKSCRTVTRKFVCLSDKDQSETPDAEEQRDLLLAGLGEVKITLILQMYGPVSFPPHYSNKHTQLNIFTFVSYRIISPLMSIYNNLTRLQFFVLNSSEYVLNLGKVNQVKNGFNVTTDFTGNCRHFSSFIRTSTLASSSEAERSYCFAI